MRRATTTVLAVVLALLPFGGASAGTPDDPEITDGCGDQPIVVAGDWPPPWLDTDTAWLSGDSEVLVLTMDMCANTPPTVPLPASGAVQGVYFFAWDVEGCVQYVRIDGPPLATTASFRQVCGGDPEEEVAIPPSDIAFSGDRVEVTLRFDGALAALGFGLGPGQKVVLRQPRTKTFIIADDGQHVVEGESAGPGRTFVLHAPGA